MIEQFLNIARQSTPAEWIAFISALAYVILATYEKVWCWPMALISTLFYFYVCLMAHLYLETILQVFYFIMGIYGWYHWKNTASKHQDVIMTSRYSLRKNIPLLILGALLSPILGLIFATYTNASQPYLDAAVTTFSLIATWMTAQKILENWIYWIVIDAAAILLYARKDLYLTALLYLLYTILAFYGYYQWKKAMPKVQAL